MQYDTFFAGAYQIEKVLERTEYSVLGMGKKLDTELPVMLRLWFTAHATTAEAQERIQAEVAALQQLQHPHLLPLLEVRTSAQGVFWVSAHASSGSLHERIQQQLLKPLPLEEALQLIQQVGQGLHALHQQGMTHGNLTPHAVFFSEPGHARLGEFRVKSILESIENYQPALEERVPRSWYMAPEQFHGVCSAQSDQYALGCLAYLLLTGQVPFAGSARATLLQKHQRDQPKSLVERNPAIPLHVEAALFKALAKHPAERYSSVQEFLEALEDRQRTAIADQDTLAQAFGVALASQEAVEQLAFDAVFEEPASDLSGWEAFAPSEEPVTAATWTRTRASGVSPVVLAKPVGSRQPARRSLKTRGRFVLPSLAFLVLVIVFAAGRWLLFPGDQMQPQQSSRLTMQATTTATSTQDSSLSASPTPPPSPSSSAGPVPTSPAGGLAEVTPVLDCVTPTGNNLVAHFGYLNPNAFAVTIPLGRENVVSPSKLDGSQPTSFAPGSQHEVFQITFFKRQSVSWSLKGSTATASSNSLRC